MVKIREIMHGITVVTSDMSVLQVAAVMKEKNIGSVLIDCFGEIGGILTERDMLEKVILEQRDAAKTLAREIMTPVIFTIEAEEEITKASELFEKHNIRRLPVTRNGKIVGEVTATDVAKALPVTLYSRISSMRRMERNHYPEF